jgi:hypothetical protein
MAAPANLVQAGPYPALSRTVGRLGKSPGASGGAGADRASLLHRNCGKFMRFAPDAVGGRVYNWASPGLLSLLPFSARYPSSSRSRLAATRSALSNPSVNFSYADLRRPVVALPRTGARLSRKRLIAVRSSHDGACCRRAHVSDRLNSFSASPLAVALPDCETSSPFTRRSSGIYQCSSLQPAGKTQMNIRWAKPHRRRSLRPPISG